MRIKLFISIWFVISLLLTFEFFALNHGGKRSLLLGLQNRHVISETINLSPEPGRPISLFLGYAGFALMILTNLYIFRKRLSSMAGIGKVSNWLDFHIFCGLAGPTFILFHCNFKVRGLVAISFWSMVVSVSSGVIGRYFYVQISKLKSEFLADAENMKTKLIKFAKKVNFPDPEKNLVTYQTQALAFAGALPVPSNPFSAFYVSMVGDLKLAFSSPPCPADLGEPGKFLLARYARFVRKANTVDAFKSLMGYWHTFHMPFAVFMYIAAVFHIIAALMFGVDASAS
jgi:hypothetical protein